MWKLLILNQNQQQPAFLTYWKLELFAQSNIPKAAKVSKRPTIPHIQPIPQKQPVRETAINQKELSEHELDFSFDIDFKIITILITLLVFAVAMLWRCFNFRKAKPIYTQVGQVIELEQFLRRPEEPLSPEEQV